MACQNCFQPGPAHYVELHHNVGMLVVRQTYATRARLCRACLHRAYGHHMVRNLTLGWWGTLSFFFTWFYLLSNTVTYLSALQRLRRGGDADATPAPAPPARLEGDDAMARLRPFEHNVRMRLRAGESVKQIGDDLASMQDVVPAVAAGFVDEVARQSADRL
jgi:hypothetical protein